MLGCDELGIGSRSEWRGTATLQLDPVLFVTEGGVLSFTDMKTIKVDKIELLTKLRKNRATHQKEFDQAKVAHRKKVIAMLEKALKSAKGGGKIDTHEFLKLPKPVCYSDAYSKAIQMLEMSVETVIEVDDAEFGRYVNDNWEWSDFAKASNSFYTSK